MNARHASPLPEPKAGIILLLACAGFFSSAALRVCDALLPRLGQDFGITPGESAQVVTGFALAYGLMQLVFGPLADRYGKTTLMCIALFGSAIGAVLSLMATSFAGLVAARVFWGMAAAGVIPLAMAWIGDALPYERRQATLARFLLGTLSGMIAGQFIGGVFASLEVGWRGAFAGFAVGYVIVGALLARYIIHTPGARGPTPSPSQDRPRASARFAAVLRVRWSHAVLFAVFAEGMFLLGALAFIPSYLHDRYGLPIVLAAALTALHAVGGLIYALQAGRIIRRLGERGMVWYGGLTVGVAFAAWWFIPVWGASVPIALLLGFGTYMLHNTLQTHGTQMAPMQRGTAMSLFAFSLFIGQALGVWLCGQVIDRAGYAPLLLAGAVAVPLISAGFARALARRAAA